LFATVRVSENEDPGLALITCRRHQNPLRGESVAFSREKNPQQSSRINGFSCKTINWCVLFVKHKRPVTHMSVMFCVLGSRTNIIRDAVLGLSESNVHEKQGDTFKKGLLKTDVQLKGSSKGTGHVFIVHFYIVTA